MPDRARNKTHFSFDCLRARCSKRLQIGIWSCPYSASSTGCSLHRIFIPDFLTDFFSFLFILPSFKHVSPQHRRNMSAPSNAPFADDEKPACFYEYDSSSSSFQILPLPGFSGLVVRGGRKSEISVRHTPCSIPDAMKASLTLEAWKALMW